MSTTPWRPSKPVAYLLFVLSLLPVIEFFLFLGFVGYVFAVSPKEGFDAFRYVFPVHIATMLLMFALIATYLVHAFRTDQLASDRRILWVIVLLFFGLFAFPVYWWLYIRPGAMETHAPA